MSNHIDICICTFQRAHIAETLRSLAQLELHHDWQIRVIVADNDDNPSAKNLVEKAAQENNLNCAYIHAPARNISLARNACLDAATAPLLAFIDDDEIATPHWLEALVAKMQSGHFDAVLGPVNAIYDPSMPEWMKRNDVFSTRPVWVKGEVVTGYCGNVLIKRTSQAFQNLRFNERLGCTGGEDTIFFNTAHKAGAKIGYVKDAIINEVVPPHRAHLGWLTKRSFRSGQTHGLLLLQNGSGFLSHIKNIFLATIKTLFSMVMALFSMKSDRKVFWFLRGTMHAGVVARLFGIRELRNYGQKQ